MHGSFASCRSFRRARIQDATRLVSAPVSRDAKQRAQWELIGGGVGIHWPLIDEDISVASLLQPEHFMRLPDVQSLPKKSPQKAGKKAGQVGRVA
jgi:hypothetical protein